MKYTAFFTVVIALLILISAEARSQEVKVDVKGNVIEETDNRANQKTDEAINAGFDKIEEGIGNLLKKKDKKANGDTGDADGYADSADGEKPEPENSQPETGANQSSQHTLTWNKYDFVPGEK
ncbi:hypothetical protein EG830_02765, partial [bacterium]|nr:hypothetical protein [bacterium]